MPHAKQKATVNNADIYKMFGTKWRLGLITATKVNQTTNWSAEIRRNDKSIHIKPFTEPATFTQLQKHLKKQFNIILPPKKELHLVAEKATTKYYTI